VLPTKTIMNIDEEIKKAESTIEYWQERIKNLKKEKQTTEDLLCDYIYRGFAISEKSEEKILEWETEHNMECRNRYIDYIFTKTELGTALSVICPKCKKELTGLCCSSDPLYSDKE